jgi:hypothetical protein
MSAGDLDPDSRFDIHRPQVVSDFVDGEVVAVNLESGTYFALYRTSALVWEFLIHGATPREILDTLVPDPAGRPGAHEQLEAFVSLLLQHDLLCLRESGHGPETLEFPSVSPRPPWEGLELHAHSDLQDILLLDPVHDTSDAGWPQAQGDEPQDAGPA